MLLQLGPGGKAREYPTFGAGRVFATALQLGPGGKAREYPARVLYCAASKSTLQLGPGGKAREYPHRKFIRTPNGLAYDLRAVLGQDAREGANHTQHD